jgi:tetratricopeptide (TPR) repeat protein
MSILRPVAAATFAIFLAATATRAEIMVSAPAGTQMPSAEAAIADAVSCVAAVLAYQVRDAELTCTRVIAALPDEPLGYKFRGLSYLLAHRFDKAEPDFKAAVRLKPEDSENHAGLAQALSGQGRYAESIPGFDRALAIAPEDVRFLAARCWARAGEGRDLSKALADCNRAVDLAPELAAPRANRGMVRLKQQNWPAAIQDYTRALDSDPFLPTALFGRGYAHAHVQNMELARADIVAARRLDPSIDVLFIRMGVLPESCRAAESACPLPQELRPNVSDQPVVMVSYRNPQPDDHKDMDSTLRKIALGRMEAMLERTAELLETRMRADLYLGLSYETPSEAVKHVVRLQQEFRAQQAEACGKSLVTGPTCRAPNFHPSATMADDPFALRWEIEHTMNEVQPFWQSVCRARQARCILE